MFGPTQLGQEVPVRVLAVADPTTKSASLLALKPDLLEVSLNAMGCSRGNFGDDGGNQTTNHIVECVERIAMDNSKKRQSHQDQKEENILNAIKRSKTEPYGYLSQAASMESKLSLTHSEMDPRFVAKEKWRNNNIAYPNIEIAGFPKAGTSQLYNILTNRPDTVAFHPSNKEFCSGTMSGTDEDLQQRLYKWAKKTYRDNLPRINNTATSSLPTTMENQKPLQVVNGCISIEDVIIRHNYLHLAGTGTQKIVVLFRDPAEWMWATWNFWTDSNNDVDEGPASRWTNKTLNYRSPELFHEMFAAGPDKTKMFSKIFTVLRRQSVKGIYSLWAAVGRENVLLLKSEDMKPNVVNATGGFLDRLSSFTGLDRSLYSDQIFKFSNCNNAKGVNSICSGVFSATYDIAGGRELLPETRDLVYLYFWEECKIWSKAFGVHYPDCVDVITNNASSNHITAQK